MCKERRGDIYRYYLNRVLILCLLFQASDRSYFNTSHPYRPVRYQSWKVSLSLRLRVNELLKNVF